MSPCTSCSSSREHGTGRAGMCQSAEEYWRVPILLCKLFKTLILKQINPEYSLERLRAGEVGDRGWEGWMASSTQWTWAFEKTPGASEGQGNLACCSPGGHKELDTTEQLNNKIFTKSFWLLHSSSLELKETLEVILFNLRKMRKWSP